MRERLALAAVVAVAVGCLAGPSPAVADALAPAAPQAVPVVLDGTTAVVRWRNPDPTVARVVVRRAEGAVAPASPSDGTQVFDGTPETGLQLASDSVVVGDTYTYGYWSFTSSGAVSSAATHSIKATAVPLLVTPPLASDTGVGSRFRLRWGNPANPAGNPYTVKYAVRDPRTGVLPDWTIWLLDTSSTQAVFHGSPGVTYAFEVLSQDPYGNDTRHALGSTSEPLDTRPTGGWTTLRSARRWGGTVAVATKAGARMTWTVVGSQVTVVADRCPGCGKLVVKVDGRTRSVADTHARVLAVRQRVAVVGHLPLGRHSVTVQVVGTTGHPAVHLDGLAALD